MTDIEWVAESDWTKVKAGDLVKFENGENILIVRAEGVALSGGWISWSGDVCIWKRVGWSLFVEAPPAVVLPTEPGWYLDKDYCVWKLESDGWYFDSERVQYNSARLDAPFERLEPVPETAKKVLDKINPFIAISCWHHLVRVAAEFGVTL
jgi:hypothetical protein